MAWNLVSQGQATTTLPVPDKKVKVGVLMPHQGSMSVEFVEKTWTPLKSASPYFDKSYMLCRVPSLPLARNILVKEFLKSDAEYALWIDSDMVLQDKDWDSAIMTLVKALEDSGESIVSGLYRAKQQHGFNYAAWKVAPEELGKKGYVHVNGWTGNFFEVDVIGLGACLMKRKVLQDIQDARDRAEKAEYRVEEYAVSLDSTYRDWSMALIPLVLTGELDVVVRDEAALPVSGAAVTVEGKTVATDANGKAVFNYLTAGVKSMTDVTDGTIGQCNFNVASVG